MFQPSFWPLQFHTFRPLPNGPSGAEGARASAHSPARDSAIDRRAVQMDMNAPTPPPGKRRIRMGRAARIASATSCAINQLFGGLRHQHIDPRAISLNLRSGHARPDQPSCCGRHPAPSPEIQQTNTNASGA